MVSVCVCVRVCLCVCIPCKLKACTIVEGGMGDGGQNLGGVSTCKQLLASLSVPTYALIVYRS